MASNVISWPSMCGSNDSTFWDETLTFNTSRPELTACFQGTAIVWTECALLWLCSIIYLPWLVRRASIYRSSQRTCLYLSKLSFSICLIILSTVDLVSIVVRWSQGQDTPLYPFIASVILLLTFILACILQHLEFVKGMHTSGVFFSFWLVTLILDTLSLTSIIIQITEKEGIHTTLHVVTFCLRYSCVLVQFILSLFVDIPKVSTRHRRSYDDVTDERTPLLFSNDVSPLVSHAGDEHREPCLEEKASFLSLILHFWILPLLVRGFKQPLTFENLPNIMNRDRTRTIIGLFNTEWQSQLQPRESSTCCGRRSTHSPSLLFALLRASWKPYVVSGIIRLIGIAGEFLNPILLQVAIDLLSGNDPNYVWKGTALAFIILLANCLNSIIIQAYFKYVYLCAMHTRTAITSAVYRKALRLTPASRKTTTVGEIVNLMSVDAEKIQEAFQDVHEIWAAPVTAVIALYFLWQIIGPSAMAGVVFLLVVMPFAGYWQVTKYSELQDEQMKQKDHRIRLINEILAGIKVLKMYAWEYSFKQNVSDIREKELKALRYQVYLYVSVSVAWLCAPTLVSLAIFTTYTLISPENYLDPSKAFVSMNVIQVLNFSVSFLSIWLAMAAQAYTSIKRITRVLREPELDEHAVEQDLMMSQSLVLNDATFSYGSEEGGEKAVLKHINLEVSEGELIAVVGQVGCGKSSLIQSMLGELHRIEGLIKMKGTVAYVSQQAWIQNDTLKDNILFGKNLDDARYQKVVDACALKPDLEILPGGDQTEIGEKGINLSGGQKQRISLARAVYQNKDIYLLDDPLSAVDAHVGKHLFDMVIGPDGCLKRKTRILVTHGLTYLPHVDRIVVLVDGQISEIGTYKELMDHEGAFAEFVQQYLKEAERSDEEEPPTLEEADAAVRRSSLSRQMSALLDSQPATPETPGMGSIAGSPGSRSTSLVRRPRISRVTSQVDDHVDAKAVKAQMEKIKGQRIIEEEDAEVGTIKWAVVKTYVNTWGTDIIVYTILSLLAYMAAIAIEQIWLSAWSDDPMPDSVEEGRKQSEFRLGVYGALNVGLLLTSGFLGLALKLGALRGSRLLHSGLLYRILRAPMDFFDTTPLGRIVNRFSTDVDKIDSTIPDYLVEVLFYVAQVFATFIVISYSTPYFLITIPIFIAIYIIIQRLYMAGVRQMKRIDSIRRSPIYANFDETLVGVTCIRAFKQQERFILKNDRLVDNSQIAWYPVAISQRWLGVSLECVGAFIIFFAIMLAVLARDTISPGVAALSISIAMQSYWCVSQLVRCATDLETHVVSVERIKEYSEVRSEAAWDIDFTKPPDNWPHEGQVAFKGYSTRYRPGLDYVLKDLTFNIAANEKVGIVGRTGAGKSSIALSLFRIIEAANGRIIVDGVDIATLGLHQLRGKLTIIPQDPVLFAGTLRHNMDPFCAYTDDEIWQSLELAHLKTYVSGLDDGLEHECGESGQNLSVGQRQLVCLARALLRRSRVLLLDEATAAVDLETDELIQATIRSAFKECTILTIAHRINTIMDYDRVIVLASGKIKEFDSPNVLLQNPDSAFYALAKDASLVT